MLFGLLLFRSPEERAARQREVDSDALPERWTKKQADNARAAVNDNGMPPVGNVQ